MLSRIFLTILFNRFRQRIGPLWKERLSYRLSVSRRPAGFLLTKPLRIGVCFDDDHRLLLTVHSNQSKSVFFLVFWGKLSKQKIRRSIVRTTNLAVSCSADAHRARRRSTACDPCRHTDIASSSASISFALLSPKQGNLKRERPQRSTKDWRFGSAQIVTSQLTIEEKEISLLKIVLLFA